MIGATVPELVPSASEWWTAEFEAEACAFESGALLDSGMTGPLYDAWRRAGATDNFTWRGEALAIADGEFWRFASAPEHGRPVWTLPWLTIDGEHFSIPYTKAADALAIDPIDGSWRLMIGVADVLPAYPQGWDFTYRLEPWSWLMWATSDSPPGLCILDPGGPEAERLLRTADLHVWSSHLPDLRRQQQEARTESMKRLHVTGRTIRFKERS